MRSLSNSSDLFGGGGHGAQLAEDSSGGAFEAKRLDMEERFRPLKRDPNWRPSAHSNNGKYYLKVPPPLTNRTLNNTPLSPHNSHLTTTHQQLTNTSTSLLHSNAI
jgi:hypothetical protein